MAAFMLLFFPGGVDDGTSGLRSPLGISGFNLSQCELWWRTY
jgi:hypothetical protein